MGLSCRYFLYNNFFGKETGWFWRLEIVGPENVWRHKIVRNLYGKKKNLFKMVVSSK